MGLFLACFGWFWFVLIGFGVIIVLAYAVSVSFLWFNDRLRTLSGFEDSPAILAYISRRVRGLHYRYALRHVLKTQVLKLRG